MELWAGIECTVNRVGNTFFDQLKASGHDCRPEDLNRLYDLGIRTLRYPFLWERAAPDHPDRYDWAWSDERLAQLRALSIQPIAGLLHHGSGPAYTSLIDPAFPAYFARYAAAFARRYPWVTDYTPINEPLTTARFSGLYGHWYPHAREERTFLVALVNQCRAIQLAMQEIRKINPAARLIQTEDMGKYWAVPGLEECAEFLNARRWLSFDLLCGRVHSQHSLRWYLLDNGVTNTQLQQFREAPCIPDLLGINYYVTSERLIDSAFTEYPPSVRGDFAQHGYVDMEAVRTEVPISLSPILQEVWARYNLPIVITEAHLNCTREEQMRWLLEIWQTALASKKAGIDLRAVTTWSVFGAFHWDKLLTCQDGCYESGLFDVRGPVPRQTAMTGLVKSLLTGTAPEHPVLARPGWWRRKERVFYPRPGDTIAPDLQDPAHSFRALQPSRPVLIIGANMIAQALVHNCVSRALDHQLLAAQELDITDPIAVYKVLAALNPWAVIYTDGYHEPNAEKINPGGGDHHNARGLTVLASACVQATCQFMTYAYRAPEAVSDGTPLSLVITTGSVFGCPEQDDFIYTVLGTLQRGEHLSVANDILISPAYLPDLVTVSLDLLIDDACGNWHLANCNALNLAQFAEKIASAAGLDPALIIGGHPLYGGPGSDHEQLMPGLERSLKHYLEMAAEFQVFLGSAPYMCY